MSGESETVAMPNGKSLNLDKNGYIVGTVEVGVSELVEHDSEEVLDLLGERLTGSDFLMNAGYRVDSVTDEGRIILRVWGDPSVILEHAEYEMPDFSR